MSIKNKLLILINIIVVFNCFGQEFLSTLNTKTNFSNLSSLPLIEKYGQVSALKLVYDLKTRKIYYINSKYYKYHFEFCNSNLQDESDLESFNKINYSKSNKRRYLLANLNYYRNLNKFALEISAADLIKEEDVLFLLQTVSKTSFIKELYFYQNTSRFLNLSDEFKNKFPLLSSSHIYKNSNYQVISKSIAHGTLRIINDYDRNLKISPTDIIVIDKLPRILPNVSGVIINEFQTPLSHLSLLGQNRKIPICAHKLAFKDSLLIRLNNKNVRFEVLRDTFRIELSHNLKFEKEERKKIKLKSNLKTDYLVDIKDLNSKSFKFSGHKANNMGRLFKISKKSNFKVPEGAFVIPFFFYDKHVKKNSINNLILSLHNSKPNGTELKSQLKNIRRAIKLEPINKTLLNEINKKVQNNGGWIRMRFRSSTNAEDIKGFSGAGLYSSKTGILFNDNKSFEKAIKKVWASLWSYEAYLEREYFDINQKDVLMGVLVHRSFPKEEVNGVAITKNIYRKNSHGFIVNAQVGETSVVKPEQGIICDQFICYPNSVNNLYKGKTIVDIITQSNINDNGKLVMSDKEILNLANQLESIKKYFYRHSYSSKSYTNFGLDVEFKLDNKNRDLYIKQVRLFND